MLVGFASGKLFELADNKRSTTFLKIGLGALVLFTVLRFINIYGDLSLWTSQKNNLFTFLSFINVTKYPPSLLYSLVTLGIMFLILAFADQVRNNFTQFCIHLWKSSSILLSDSLVYCSSTSNRNHVPSGIFMDSNGFCFRKFWPPQRSRKRASTLGNLYHLDRSCPYFILSNAASTASIRHGQNKWWLKYI